MPDSLLLKLNQSVLDSWPVLVMLEIGRLMTKALVEVVMLKMLPAVPVETLLMLLTEPRPKDEVATKVGAALPLLWRICPAVPTKLERKVVPS